jgi:tetratricopeptide (TPR) repeat protein
MVGTDRLRPLWNPLDLDATERNLRTAFAAEASAAGRAEVLTQLARVQLVRGRPDAANSLLDEASSLAGDDTVVRARVLLERGRVLRRSGSNEAALATLEQAYDAALSAGQHFMAADAAHSCALAGDMVRWTNRGLDLAERFPAAAYWRGTLLLNLGDWQWERGDREASLSTFEAALVAAEATRATRRAPNMPAMASHARFVHSAGSGRRSR